MCPSCAHRIRHGQGGREKQGTTHFPAILKKPVSAQEIFDTLGFDKSMSICSRRSVTRSRPRMSMRLSLTFSASVKQLGQYVGDYNSAKSMAMAAP